MKYGISFLVAVAVLWIYALQHPMPDDALPLWIQSVVGALIFTLPLSLLCRVVTKRISGLKARAVDLGILFGVVGGYWGASLALSGIPDIVRSPALFWIRLSWDSWLSVFLPFGITMALFEWRESLKRRESNKSTQPTTVSSADSRG